MPNEDEAVIDAINRVTGAGLTLAGRAEHGTLGGAILVETRSGQPGVVTHYLGPLSDARRTASLMNALQDEGLPVARHPLAIQIEGDVLLVQERLPGTPPTDVTPALMAAIVDLNDRFAHILVERPEIPILPLCLTASGTPYPRHEVLAEHSDRSLRVLDAITTLGARFPEEMAGDDLVHVDLTPSNLLLDATGVITGVVDWNLGAFRGDRHLALVKTRFELEWGLRSPVPEPSLVASALQLDDVLATRVPEADLQKYWAHRLLHQLHWCLQFAPPDVVDWHLDLAEDHLL